MLAQAIYSTSSFLVLYFYELKKKTFLRIFLNFLGFKIASLVKMRKIREKEDKKIKNQIKKVSKTHILPKRRVSKKLSNK